MQKLIVEATEQWDKKVITVEGDDVLNLESYKKEIIRPRDVEPTECFSLKKGENDWYLSTSYFIGVDWLEEKNTAIRITPKYNLYDNLVEIDYLKMLEDALKEPKNFEHLDGLLYVDFDSPSISIPKQDDMLSLFLVSEFLHIMSHITAKGLRKSYYYVEDNLHSKIKGKIMLIQNLKRNNIRGSYSDNYCRYQEYGVDNPENRLLKKALLYCSHILDSYNEDTVLSLKRIILDILPSWKNVNARIEPKDVNEKKVNPFYKEYPIGLHIARILLKHSSYNHILHGVGTTETPPYWIDMSKLFEMYVFEKLRIQFGDDVIYHPHFRGQEPDYLICPKEERPPYIVDAKYKRYSERPIETDDIRQVSGYARMKAVRSKLKVVDNSLIPCVIIYPDQEMDDKLADYNDWIDEGRYLDIFKTGIQLPLI